MTKQDSSVTSLGSQPDESEYLFQLQQGTKNLNIFHIPKKKLKTYKLGFRILDGCGFCHVKSELYLGGGSRKDKYDNSFRRITSSGKASVLRSLPTAKCFFPMTYWETEDTIITLGG